jgi:branched-chain amino acid transport system substrate-binding protein
MQQLTGVIVRMRWPARFCLGVLLIALLATCRKAEPPLRIGFVGCLTGRVAGLGVAGHDGVLLAVEEYNRAGGLKGRRVELVVRDDQLDEKVAAAVMQELLATEVVAIIGPMTSTMAAVMQPAANRAQVVLLSPTVTANRFTDQDDHFLRVTMPLKVNAGKLADYALRHQRKRIAVCIDTDNAVYTEDWLASFAQKLELGGGRVVHVERLSRDATEGFLPLVKRMLEAGPDAVLLLCGAMDTAMAAQQVRKLGSQLPLFTSEWAFTSDLIGFGGKAVEGMRAFVSYDPASQTPRHLAFLANFEKRFGYRPSFAAVLGYDAAAYLLAALERNPQREGLKAKLLELGHFPGLQGEIRVNRFGDAERQTFLAVIREGQFTADR